MFSTKPYFIRAVYEWCTDSGYTPYIKTRVDENADVPLEYVDDGEVVLNIGPIAAHNVVIENDLIRFSARFDGVSRNIRIPINSVMGIFSRETGQGLIFSDNEILENSMLDLSNIEDDSGQNLAESESSKKGKKPELRIVK